MEVTCNLNNAILQANCLGGKSKCILFEKELLTPNEFQSLCGLQHVKNWRKSIKHNGKSLDVLIANGQLDISRADRMKIEEPRSKSNDDEQFCKFSTLEPSRLNIDESKQRPKCSSTLSKINEAVQQVDDGKVFKRMVLCEEQAYDQFLKFQNRTVTKQALYQRKSSTQRTQRRYAARSKKFDWDKF